MKSYILNIETSGPVCSVGLAADGKSIILAESDSALTHAEQTTLLIKEVLHNQAITTDDLAAVAISAGPGSYTGLRIGTSVAKGIAYASNIPLIAVSSLQCIAAGLKQINNNEKRYIIPLIDARRNEIYTAVYDEADLSAVIEPQHFDLDARDLTDWLQEGETYLIGGINANKVRHYISSSNIQVGMEELIPSARYMDMLTYVKFKEQQLENIIYFEPEYLKDVYISVSDKKGN